MDKLLKVYLENSNPNIRITKLIEEIKTAMHSTINRCQSLRLQFSTNGQQEMADYVEKLMTEQSGLIGKVDNQLERYYPGIYTNKF